MPVAPAQPPLRQRPVCIQRISGFNGRIQAIPATR
jgi:hypothetical protein